MGPRLALALLLALLATAAGAAVADDFVTAWDAAGRGDRATFERLLPTLVDDPLYPYLRYEDLRHRMARVPDREMGEFIAAHEDWAFARPLQVAWLRRLGRGGRSQPLVTWGTGVDDTEVRCHRATARVKLDDTAGLADEVRELWLVGKSQDEACDPAFRWWQLEGGITPDIAWERIRLAMAAGNPRLTLYLARFVAGDERIWVERWQDLRRGGYAGLDDLRHWPDQPRPRLIAAESLKDLARRDAERAGRGWDLLSDHFGWPAEQRGAVAREIALWSAVGGADDALARMAAVPPPARDDDLLAWWARAGMARSDWTAVLEAVAQMSPEERDSDRWRYWAGRAHAELGDDQAAITALDTAAREATFYGFLAADRLDRPYSICPSGPEREPVDPAVLDDHPGVGRALLLRQHGIDNWANAEWSLATRDMPPPALRAAAVAAVEADWPDRAIFALGRSGDLDWYGYRFPLDYRDAVAVHAADRGLDASWVLGLMRSESAMIAQARSPAGALGLMQVMPGTARQIARRNGFAYSSSRQLLEADTNIRFGTAYLDQVLADFDGNMVLATGAYNAGPGAVSRWLDDRGDVPIDVWVETITYRETREYIPRVLAFTTLYDWRQDQPVRRLSTRMAPLDSGRIGAPRGGGATDAEVVCLARG